MENLGSRVLHPFSFDSSLRRDEYTQSSSLLTISSLYITPSSYYWQRSFHFSCKVSVQVINRLPVLIQLTWKLCFIMTYEVSSVLSLALISSFPFIMKVFKMTYSIWFEVCHGGQLRFVPSFLFPILNSQSHLNKLYGKLYEPWYSW